MSKRSLSELRNAIGRMRSREQAHGDAPERAPDQFGSAPIIRRDVRLLDWVRLSRPFSGWPAGTIGAVVDLKKTEALIEISDEFGNCVDLFDVPLELLYVDG